MQAAIATYIVVIAMECRLGSIIKLHGVNWAALIIKKKKVSC